MEFTQKKPQILDKRTALLKAESWCAYQERSQKETRNKLYEYGLHQNEERFAMAYVSGKVNIKKWGRIKIKQGLKFKKVPDKLIQKALNSIDADQYLGNLLATAEKKIKVLTEKDPLKKKYKLITYLQTKGFEKDLIFDVLKTNSLTE